MDKEYLNKHNLTESQKRFQSILEYVVGGSSNVIREAGPQDEDPNAMPGGPDMGGGMPQQGGPDMGGGAPMDPSAGGGMPPQGGPDAGGEAPMGEDPNAAPGGPDMGGESQGVAEFNPQGAAPGGEDGQGLGPDDEVIDVDELVDSQDETKSRVNRLSGKIESLIDMISKFEKDIDSNNQHIEELKQEIEKRNPTQVEKMTLRANKGYPFSQSPDEYWANKQAEGEYSPESDNDGVGDERYAITKSDVDGISDWDSIYKSIEDGSFHQDLKDILKL